MRRMMLDGENHINKFYAHITKYDKMRNNDFATAFPKWNEILENELRSNNTM